MVGLQLPTKRSQQVEVKHTNNGKPVKLKQLFHNQTNHTRIVPQVSVAGPLLLIIFNNIQGSSKTPKYANDTVLLLGKQRAELLKISFVAPNILAVYNTFFVMTWQQN